MSATARKTTVPFYGVAREFAQHRSEYLARIEAIMASGQMLQGPEVEGLELRVSSMADRAHAVAVGSCTDALFFGLVAVGVRPGDEVLVTDYSFPATATCILRAGATPVFVDVDEGFGLGLARAESLVTQRTRAVVHAYLYGRMADPEPLERFARERRLPLVIDAAQVLGATYRGRPSGSVGTVACVSFDPTKVVSAPGSGGMLLTDDDDVASAVRGLRYHGRTGGRGFMYLGYNSQISAISAGLLGLKLDHAEAWLGRRRQIAARYAEALGKIESLTLPKDSPEAQHIYHKFAVQAEDRDELRARLESEGVQTMVHYDTPMHREPVFAHIDADDSDFPVAGRLSRSMLSLPVHPFLTDQEVGQVTDAVLGFYATR